MASSSHLRSSGAATQCCRKAHADRLLSTLTGRDASARRRTAYDVRSDADPEARETLQRDARLVQHLLDGLLVVLGERLLQQDVLLEEAVDAAFDDLGQGGLRL